MVSNKITLIVTLCMLLVLSAPIYAKNDPIAKKGEYITIVTANDRARLCPVDHCEQDKHLLRIPTKTKLKVILSKTTSNRLFNVIWYKVTYKGKTGWVSEFDTNMAPKTPRYK